MIDDVSLYDCEEKGCGRKFDNREALLNHYQRRHIDLYHKFQDSEEILEDIDENVNKDKDILSESQMHSTTSLERVRMITEEMIGVGVKYGELDEIEEVSESYLFRLTWKIETSLSSNSIRKSTLMSLRIYWRLIYLRTFLKAVVI
jgi:hypothetical protein